MAGIPFILKGFLIGIIAAIPVGPVLMMTLQKSVSDGRQAGFSSGLGGTAVDTICAIVSAFTITSIGVFVDAHSTAISLIGGLFIMFVGFNMFRTHIPKERRKKPYSPKNFVKTFTMGLSNPAALALALKDAKARMCKRFLMLGDTTGYGYDVKESIKLVRRRLCWLCSRHSELICTNSPSGFQSSP